jgi:hypothetical protein
MRRFGRITASGVVSLLAIISLTLSPVPARLAVAQSVASQASATPTPSAQVLATPSTIVVQTSICQSIGGNANCGQNNFDRSLGGYSIDFEVYRGTSPVGTPEDVITVTLDQAAGGKGKDVSGLLLGTIYTVCEVPVAIPPNGGTPASVNIVPILTGSNESLVPGYPLCITAREASARWWYPAGPWSRTAAGPAHN